MVNKRIGLAILGSTGSIGVQTLDVVDRFPDKLRVVALAAETSVDALAGQYERYRPAIASLMDPKATDALRGRIPAEAVHTGMDGLLTAATHPDVNVVVVSVRGAIGLLPTLAALEAGKTVALASKEVLVAGGDVVMRASRKHGAPVVPIDSEHSALYQCLHGEEHSAVSKLILTASGGPFRNCTREEIERVTVADALAHPTWNMGAKITVDSATLMNKGLEVIEAHWLFDVPAERIDVVVHPQSIVHSMVEFVDGSVLAQMGLPDMRLPIQYALFYPERAANDLPRLCLPEVGSLTFEKPDLVKFPALALAFEAARVGGSMPAVLSAANETAVAMFLEERIGFTMIADTVREAMTAHETTEVRTVDDVLTADEWARRFVREMHPARVRG